MRCVCPHGEKVGVQKGTRAPQGRVQVLMGRGAQFLSRVSVVIVTSPVLPGAFPSGLSSLHRVLFLLPRRERPTTACLPLTHEQTGWGLWGPSPGAGKREPDCPGSGQGTRSEWVSEHRYQSPSPQIPGLVACPLVRASSFPCPWSGDSRQDGSVICGFRQAFLREQRDSQQKVAVYRAQHFHLWPLCALHQAVCSRTPLSSTISRSEGLPAPCAASGP